VRDTRVLLEKPGLRGKDLAIGVVIGAAFAKIISALVDAVIMPLVSKIVPSGSYLSWAPGGVRLDMLIGA